jgi:hypothetical protein
LKLQDGFDANSGIDELLHTNLKKISDVSLHRTGDLLWKHHEVIEKYLSQKAQEIFSLDNTIILIRLTNTYFESSKKNSDIAAFGRSKEKRSDCPIVTLALVVF